MTKIRTSITIDEELHKIAHHHKIRINTFLDNTIRDYLSKINGKNRLHMAEVAGSNPANLTNFNRYKFFRLMVFHPFLYIQLIIQTIKKI